MIENAESRARLSQLAEEQAALRRVATLVARGTPAQELFAAVAEEVGRLLPVGSAAMGRYDPDGMFTTVAAWSATDVAFGVGQRWPPDGKHVTGIVFRTGRPARLDDFSDASGPVGDHAREAGYRSAVGTPIMVEGRLWGVMTAATTAEEPLPESTETRLASFTELVATAIANTESRVGLARLAEEQAALRRVAELVARHSSPDEVFTAVSEAVGILLGADLAAMHVFPGDGEATTIAGWSAAGPMLPIGTRLPLDGDSVVARIFRTGEAARMDTYVGVEGETATVARGLSLRTTVGAPIHVDGQLWGALMAATRGVDPFPDDAETRIAVFTRLVATAISNTEAREAVARLADEQSALRRVATLVAQGVRAAEIFSAVSDEVARLLGSSAAVLRFEHGPPPAVFVVGSSNSVDLPPGTRVELEDGMATAKVYRDGRSARADRTASSPGPTDATMRRLGIVSTVASPVVVEGRLWGAMVVASAGVLLPLDAEARLEKFTELVATAIANADSKAQLAASRRRIVAASDDARRRIERDLHDGTQQRLVSLGLAVRAVEAVLPPGSGAGPELSRIASGLNDAVTELQEISRGIHPAILSQGGLGPALRTLARRSAIPVELEVAMDARLPEAIEVAAYYVASEALANAAKHAGASRIALSLAPREGELTLSIRDDGVGGADPAHGSGLVGLTDRVEALNGSMHVESRPGEGTLVVATLPLEVEVPEES